MSQKPFRQRRIWHLLRERGPMHARDLMDATGYSKQAMYQIAQKLLAKGCVTREGSTWKTLYTATDVAPHDRRGRDANAAVNLAVGREVTRQFTRYRTGALPPPSCPLEQAMRGLGW